MYGATDWNQSMKRSCADSRWRAAVRVLGAFCAAMALSFSVEMAYPLVKSVHSMVCENPQQEKPSAGARKQF